MFKLPNMYLLPARPMTTMPQEVEISLSVVSHGQMSLVLELLRDVGIHCQSERLEVILTLNVGAETLPVLDEFVFPVCVIRNPVPRGFGANHNQAFAQARGTYFCVINPDIRLTSDPFPALIAELAAPQVGVAAPRVLGVDGRQEDSARSFPTPLAIARRVLTGRHVGVHTAQSLALVPDWIGGMFMLFAQPVYRELCGFDERYFLYYEDVDLCARLRLSGRSALLCQQASVIHAAQRSSHKSLRYLRWHLGSMLRFFTSATFMRLWRRGMV